MTAPDRRRARTRTWLQTALLELLREKSFDAITIQDIVDRADTARVTFYRHYQDKEALLLDCLETMYREVVPHLPDGSIREALVSDQPPPILKFYQHVADNQALYRTIFSNQIPSIIRERMHQYIANTITTSIMSEKLADQIRLPIDVLANYLAASSLGNIRWWLENDTPYPIDYFARTTHWLGMVGVIGFLAPPIEVSVPDLESYRPATSRRPLQRRTTERPGRST